MLPVAELCGFDRSNSSVENLDVILHVSSTPFSERLSVLSSTTRMRVRAEHWTVTTP